MREIFKDIPEACDATLEIAKKYSSSDASAFINGILDHVVKTESQSLSE